jgi:Domain of unknown function (DUF4249)
MKKILNIYLLFFITFGCKKEIDIDVPIEKSKIVIHSDNNANQPIWQFTIGKSIGIETEYQIGNSDVFKIDSLSAYLFEDNVLIDSLFKYSGNTYRTHWAKPKVGKKYRLEAKSPSLQSIYAETFAPNEIKIDTCIIIKKAANGEYGNLLDEVTLVFKDDGNYKNFYEISVYGTQFRGNVRFYSNDESFAELNKHNESFYTYKKWYSGYSDAILVDSKFNGLLKTVKLYVDSGSLDPFLNSNNVFEYAVIKLSNITPQYFKYIQSSFIYNNNKDNPFAEPSNIYGNITNGFGYFTISNTQLYFIK